MGFSDIRKLMLLLKVKPTLEDMEKQMHAKITTTTVAQILLDVMHLVNLVQPSLSGKHQLIAAAVIGILQILVNLLSHWSNPDGTPASVAYIPK